MNSIQIAKLLIKASKVLLAEAPNDVAKSAMEWKNIPEEEKARAYDLIEQHNKTVDQTVDGCYGIDVTGKYQAYYTFWRYKDIPSMFSAVIKNPVYMGNLSTDLISAIQNAINKPAVKNVRIELWTEGTRENLIGKTKKIPTFKFGKYRGKPMYDVYLENPSYFAWLKKNRDPNYYTETDQIIDFFSDMYFKDVTKKNQETSKSTHVGTTGDQFVGEVEVYKMEEKVGDWGSYTSFKLKDKDDNKFLTTNLNKTFPNIKVGDKINISGKITDHKEFLGIKFTVLKFIKPAQVESSPQEGL